MLEELGDPLPTDEQGCFPVRRPDGQRNDGFAVEAGYGSVRTASRAYRSRAAIGLREIWRDGAAALLPAFLAAVQDSPAHRLAS